MTVADEYHTEYRNVAAKENFAGKKVYTVRGIHCKGEHDSLCEQTDDGWICVDDCPVNDMISFNAFVNEIDELIDVEEEIERDGWFMRKGVHWSMTRLSARRTFKNGRSFKSDCDYVRDKWFSGRTWTRWGAKKQAREHRVKSRSSMSYG